MQLAQMMAHQKLNLDYDKAVSLIKAAKKYEKKGKTRKSK